MQKDFKHGYGPGSFAALFNARMDNAATYRADYGRRPNRCHFDPDEEFKLRNTANPEFQIFSNWNDLIQVYFFRIGKIFMLRAQKEVSLFLQNYIFICSDAWTGSDS